MLPQEVIRVKRDGGTLSPEQIEFFVKGVTAGTITEGQVGAFAMAVLLKGMTMDERVALTRAMTHSGAVMDWKAENLPGPVIDKHSTGGVGDKVSLVLAPILAACGGFVPMISGRGLGHTGGTLDKLEAIPGYDCRPDPKRFAQVTREIGCAVVGATPDTAPADRIIYGVRDVTATVESIDLITASILSKKLAAGLEALVMDVKFGTGAFMQDYGDALILAQSLCSVANGAGLPTTAMLTDMNQVLGHAAGNAVEISETIDILTGAPDQDARLVDVILEQAAELMLLGGLFKTLAQARAAAETALSSGDAAERFARMVAALGGPSDLLEKPAAHLRRAAVIRPLFMDRAGHVAGLDVRAIGLAIVTLGGGRARAADPVDHSVGLTQFAPLGAKLDPHGRPLCVLHAKSESDWQAAAEALRAAVTLADAAPAPMPLIRDRLYPA